MYSNVEILFVNSAINNKQYSVKKKKKNSKQTLATQNIRQGLYAIGTKEGVSKIASKRG